MDAGRGSTLRGLVERGGSGGGAENGRKSRNTVNILIVTIRIIRHF